MLSDRSILIFRAVCLLVVGATIASQFSRRMLQNMGYYFLFLTSNSILIIRLELEPLVYLLWVLNHLVVVLSKENFIVSDV
jgi:hypothetical protein